MTTLTSGTGSESLLQGGGIVIVDCKTDLQKDKKLQVKNLQKNGLEPMTYPRGQKMVKAMGCKEQNYKLLEDNIENYITFTQRKAS